MNDLWQDLRQTVRALAKSPGFAAITILTLALGIGANSAIFSVVNAVLLRPLPYPESERLVRVLEKQPDGDSAPFSAPDFLDYQSQNQTFEHLAAVRPLNFSFTGRGEPQRLSGAVVSVNVFQLLRVKPALGRDFLPDEGKAGAQRVALLRYRYWQQRFGGDPGIVGQVITLNEEVVTIVGVLPEDFRFMRDGDVFLNPKRVVPEVFANFKGDYLTMRGMHYLHLIGRLKPGVTLAQARADMDRIAGVLQKQYTSNAGHSVILLSQYEYSVGDVRPAILALAGTVGFVLLIACANVANLLLARATARQREIAIRAALGASRGRIVRHLLTEGVVLALAGGAAGLALSFWAVNALVASAGDLLPRAQEVRVDGVVLGFTFGVAVLAGLLFSLAPAWEASRASLNEVLKEGGRTGTGGAARNRLRSLFVVGEMALSLMLLVGAGLLVRSMFSLLKVNTGFKPDNMVTMWVSFSSSKYSQPGMTENFARDVQERLEALPGVTGVAMCNDLPLEGQDTTSTPTIEGQPPFPPGQEILMGMHVITPGFFRAMGVPLLRGREVTSADAAGAAPVIIINETAAKKLFPGEDPLGRRIRMFGTEKDPPSEVVGVVADLRHNDLASGPSLDAYGPIAQNPWAYLAIIIRTSGDPAAIVPSARREVLAVDPNQPVFGVRTMEQVLAETVGTRHTTLILVSLFAGLALVLAAVGIYGVMSYAVTQRGHEMGIRMALGAQRGDIFRLVAGQGMKLTGAGVALGLAGAFGVTRFLSTLLFGVQPADPLTFAGVAFLLTTVAALACYIPARRATRVDPLVALRYE